MDDARNMMELALITASIPMREKKDVDCRDKVACDVCSIVYSLYYTALRSIYGLTERYLPLSLTKLITQPPIVAINNVVQGHSPQLGDFVKLLHLYKIFLLCKCLETH